MHMQKRLFLMLALAGVCLHTWAQETTMFRSRTFDNMYIGLEGGGALKVKDATLKDDLNGFGGLRIGRNFTPVLGFAIEGDAYLRANPIGGTQMMGTTVKYVGTSLLTTVNFSNWFGGYHGRSRVFEVSGVYGLGWGHSFNNTHAKSINNLISEAGVNLAVNLGHNRAWQIYAEPTMRWSLNGNGYSGIEYNLSHAFAHLTVGLAYKFRNSNGTHGFALAELRDQSDIELLNARLNELRRDITERDRAIAEKNHAIAGLQTQLSNARKEITDYEKRPTVTTTVMQVTKANLQPIVVFPIGSCVVEKNQQGNLSLIAKYMRENPDSKIEIRGYTSPDGSAEINQQISLARASAVKDMLVQKYGINPTRLTAIGMGATSSLFDDMELNRVVTFTDITR